MLKIGDFSKLGHVTIKALRHYERVGLLKPAWIDRFSGYRYYSIRQFPRLNRIIVLKELGFSLEQILGMLDDTLPIEKLREVLVKKQVEQQQRVNMEQKRLSWVEHRLHQIEREGHFPGFDVVVKPSPPINVASMRIRMEDEFAPNTFCLETQSKLAAWLAAQNIHSTGLWLEIDRSQEYVEGKAEVEIAVEVLTDSIKNRPTNNEGIRLYTLPGEPYIASLFHVEGKTLFEETYPALYAWMDSHGYIQSGAVRCLRLEEKCSESPVCLVIEVQCPVQKIEIPGSLIHKTTRKDEKMEPKIVTKPAFMVVGQRYLGKNQNQEITRMWDMFLPRLSEIKTAKRGISYGLCMPPRKDGLIDYIACVEVEDFDRLPERMVAKMVPEQTYAVFPHRGSVKEIVDTYHYAIQVWMPQAGYQMGDGPDFEFYNEEFRSFSEGSVLYIYIPIKTI